MEAYITGFQRVELEAAGVVDLAELRADLTIKLNLPVEELIFFLLTNTLIVFGMTLALAAESQPRLQHYKALLTRKRDPQSAVADQN